MMRNRIRVKESTLVRSAAATPRTTMWISNLDTMMQMNHHTPVVYLFPFNGDSNFFDLRVLKHALSRALVPFYPVAGRWNQIGNRIEIDCNDEGVLLVEAEVDGRMDELENFYPKPDLQFCPVIDYSLGISTYPLFLAQVNQFKCGGVCLGISMDHHIADGTSAPHFINTWADMARGLDVTVPPFLDRRVAMSARNPPQPQFTHIEYQPDPTLKIPQHNDSPIIFKRFKFTRDQLNVLKAKCNHNDKTTTNYTTFEVVAAHIWRCITKARQLPEDQVTRVNIPVDGRSRLQPPIPQGYFGNAIFIAAPIATAGEIVSKPLEFSVDKVHNAIARIDHDYCMSALDYLELQDDLISMARGPHNRKSPNISVTNWARLPFYDVDFGWGRPVYVGHGSIPYEGMVHMMASPVNDSNIWLSIALPENQMRRLEESFYEEINSGLSTAKGRSKI